MIVKVVTRETSIRFIVLKDISSPIILVKKKDGSYRLCTYYRKLHLVTKLSANPLPRVDDLLDALNR